MSEILAVYGVTVDDESMVVFDKLDLALDYLRDQASLGLCCMGDTVCLELTQMEMTWSDYHKISLEEL